MPTFFIAAARPLVFAILVVAVVQASQAGEAATRTAGAPASPPSSAWTSPEGQALRAALVADDWRYSPSVKIAQMAFNKADALRMLQTDGIALSADFLNWVDSDPVVAATVYGSRHAPAHLLAVLRSLELDLGADEVRRRHTSLMLAMAEVNGDNAYAELLAGAAREPGHMGLDLQPRGLLTLAIPGCPLKRVDTHPKDRPLDLNDHIINFFEGKTVEIEVKTGTKVENGKKVPVVEKRARPMAACDVLADPVLQVEFNAYMKAHGQDVAVHCGDHVIHWNSHDMVKGPDAKPILEAFRLFKTAYEAKGLLPAARDPAPTLAETCAFLIRNDGTSLAEGVKAAWPKYPLTAPWPTLTFLAQNRQPLRECEDIWRRWHDKGEFHGYGEYIGGIAQQFDFQSARRLTPYDYSYGTFQMMLKDGGVCGTMANLCVRSDLALGVPACTAGQPGHCALVYFAKNDKDGTYELKGGQFVTGGPDKTTPHVSWSFGEDSGRRPMIYPMATGYAVNHGLQSFLDAQLAWSLWRALPAADQEAHGMTLLESGLDQNPYHLLLAITATQQCRTAVQAAAWGPQMLMRLERVTQPGCPTQGLYAQTVQGLAYERLAELPLPRDAAAVKALAAQLDRESCAHAGAWCKYQAAALGLPALQAQLAEAFKAGIAGGRTPQSCALVAGRIDAVCKMIQDEKARQAYVEALLGAILGHEQYLPVGANKRAKPQQDPCAEVLLKLAGKEAQARLLEDARKKAQAEAAGKDLSQPGK